MVLSRTAVLSDTLMYPLDRLDELGDFERLPTVDVYLLELPAEVRAKQVRELAGVIHFWNQHHPLALEERAKLVIRDRPDHPRRNGIHRHTPRGRLVHGLDDSAPGGAPGDDPDLRRGISVAMRWRGEFGRALDLPDALLRHLDVRLGVVARPA